VALRSSYLTWINHLALWGPLALWLPCMWLYQNVWGWSQAEGMGADYKVGRGGALRGTQGPKPEARQNPSPKPLP
jgi:hypothetical protein